MKNLKKSIFTLIAISGFAIAPFAQAADLENGQTQLEAECSGCHGDGHYMRENRKAKSYVEVSSWVSGCKERTNKGEDWFPEDQQDVVDYLNTEFYEYEKKKK